MNEPASKQCWPHPPVAVSLKKSYFGLIFLKPCTFLHSHNIMVGEKYLFEGCWSDYIASSCSVWKLCYRLGKPCLIFLEPLHARQEYTLSYISCRYIESTQALRFQELWQQRSVSNPLSRCGGRFNGQIIKKIIMSQALILDKNPRCLVCEELYNCATTTALAKLFLNCVRLL